MGSFEIGIIILFFLTMIIIACTIVLYPQLKKLVKELQKDE